MQRILDVVQGGNGLMIKCLDLVKCIVEVVMLKYSHHSVNMRAKPSVTKNAPSGGLYLIKVIVDMQVIVLCSQGIVVVKVINHQTFSCYGGSNQGNGTTVWCLIHMQVHISRRQNYDYYKCKILENSRFRGKWSKKSLSRFKYHL